MWEYPLRWSQNVPEKKLLFTTLKIPVLSTMSSMLSARMKMPWFYLENCIWKSAFKNLYQMSVNRWTHKMYYRARSKFKIPAPVLVWLNVSTEVYPFWMVYFELFKWSQDCKLGIHIIQMYKFAKQLVMQQTTMW